jgi:lantibiotic modifying enzyme
MQVLADDISKQFKASSIFDQAITAMQKYQTETLTKLYNYIQQMLRDIETKRKTGDNNFMDLNSGIAAALYKAKSELLNIAQQISGLLKALEQTSLEKKNQNLQTN